MSYDSKLAEVQARLDRGVRGGLLAAALVLENEVKRRLAGGYTSGAFVTGHVMASVMHSDVQQGGGGYFILVGADAGAPYALFWEVGHHNLFTRRFERVEKWVPALMETREQQEAAFARVVARAMNG